MPNFPVIRYHLCGGVLFVGKLKLVIGCTIVDSSEVNQYTVLILLYKGLYCSGLCVFYCADIAEIIIMFVSV